MREGLTVLAGKEYDLVILNACFPEADGMELLKTLRGLRPMPILILSTSTALADKLETFK
ncbi:response regulator [Candidatus Soleaferrea massiliensis]|uniref:response regulator n=1 Tax=Candidatus Soleaferrea massiliensis TaxID=1470354 RepID=UPI0009E5844C|nr:response regulator [Candidatus Soleaferrea massiliensis]